MTVFEKIVINEIPSYKIYEDDKFLSFLDISQASFGHTLIIPKKNYKDIFEIDEETLSQMAKVVSRISKALKKAFNLEGLNILNNNGLIAGQTVFHFHIHLIPRYKNDKIEFHLPNNIDIMDDKKYKEIQNKILDNIK